MATEHLYTNMGMCNLFYEFELCPDEILAVLQTLDDNYNSNNNIFSVPTVPASGPLMVNKNSSINSKRNRNKLAKTPSSPSSQGFGFAEDSDEDHAMLPKRKCVKRQKVSPPATSTYDGKVVSHISVERNRRKQMNEHLAVLRQLMPSFYVKKGDQASIVGGVIDCINELHQVLRSLEAKKRGKHYTNEVGHSLRIYNSPTPRILTPHLCSYLSPLSPRTPRSTSPYIPSLIKQPLIQPSSVTSPTSNSNSSCCSIADISMMVNNYNSTCKNAIANELVASSKSSVADVDVKFCGANLELKILSSKLAGQTVRIVSAIEDLSLEILQVSVNTVKDTMFNSFTIKIGTECQLSAEELAQHIQETFCYLIRNPR